MILHLIQIILQSISTALAIRYWRLYGSRFWLVLGAASFLMVARRVTALMTALGYHVEGYDLVYLPLMISVLILIAPISAHDFERSLSSAAQRENDEFEFSTIGRAYVALDGTILKVNDALCDVWELSREEILSPSFTWQSITPEPDLSRDLALLRQLLQGVIKSYSLEKRYRRPPGSTTKYKYVQLKVWGVHDDEGELSHLSITVADAGFAASVTRSLEALDESIRGLDE